MNLSLSHIARFTTAAVLLVSAVAYAQMPQDNNVWKTRCNVLASASQAIESGTIPATLIAATHRVPAQQFTTFAFDRSAEGYHNVSCALFYLAAIADRVGNGGKADPGGAYDYAVLAGAEYKSAHGQSLTFSERLKQTTVKVETLFSPSLTSAQLQAVIDASDTMPLSLTPPQSESAQLNRPLSDTNQSVRSSQ